MGLNLELLLFSTITVAEYVLHVKVIYVQTVGHYHPFPVCLVQRLPWLGRSPAVVEEYLAFLSNLVSAQTVYLRACLKMVVSNFIPSE